MNNENYTAKPLLDYAVPLYDDDKWFGTLVVTLNGEQIDHIVNNVTRLYKGKFLITENNPDNINRHGLLVYDEITNLRIAQNRTSFMTVESNLSTALFSESIQNTEGIIKQDNLHVYYSEFFPYPNRLIGWVVATQIDENILSAPFENIRIAIWLFEV